MRPNRCPYCRSADTDRPYTRPSEIRVLSKVIPSLRRRVCRNCGRHYWALHPRRAGRRAA